MLVLTCTHSATSCFNVKLYLTFNLSSYCLHSKINPNVLVVRRWRDNFSLQIHTQWNLNWFFMLSFSSILCSFFWIYLCNCFSDMRERNQCIYLCKQLQHRNVFLIGALKVARTVRFVAPWTSFNKKQDIPFICWAEQHWFCSCTCV